MGAAPSRETHKRGLVSLEQLTGIGVDNRNGSSNGATSTQTNLSSSITPFNPNSPSLWQEQSQLLAQSNISTVNCTSKHNMVDANNSKASRNVNVQGTGGNKKQEIVLIPLTKYYFPSPDCPLFVQFHKARCDAAVNYYFRRPGNPGDLSCIPHYGNPDQTEHGEINNNNNITADDGDGDGGDVNNINRTDYYNNNNQLHKESYSLSYPSREALYRGVIDHVEEMLFDTDAEMREAYLSQGITVNCAESSEHANNGQHCNTVRPCEGSDVNNKNKDSDDNKLYTKEQIVRDQETETRQMELSGYIKEDGKTRSVVNTEDLISCKETIMEKEIETDKNNKEQAKNATYTSSIKYREELEQKQQQQQSQDKNTKTKMTPMTKKKKKQILPVLCAVAFRIHVGRSAQSSIHSNANTASLNLHVDNVYNTQQQEQQQQKQIISKEVCKESDVYSNNHRNNVLEIKAEPQYFVYNGVYAFDSVINVVGCFGFVSMEEEVASYSNAMLAAVHSRTNSAEQSNKLHSRSTTDYNTNNNYHTNNGNKSSNPSIISHNPNAHDAHIQNEESNFGCNNDKSSSLELCSSSSPLPQLQETNTSITQTNINTADNSNYYSNNNDNNDKSKKGCTSISKAALCDDLSLLSSAANHFNELMHLPPPIAAPLAAMVYLTKSAGEQNLSRITHLAACTYYYQLVHAGVLVSHSRQSIHGCNTATFTETTNTAHIAIPLSTITTATNNDNSSSNNNKDDRYVSIDATEQTTKQSQVNETMSKHKNNVEHDTICMNKKNTTHEPATSSSSVLFAAAPCIERVLPPMDTFSFSVLLTNIPILSFLYEMKWRWGYLGVLQNRSSANNSIAVEHIGNNSFDSKNSSNIINNMNASYCSSVNSNSISLSHSQRQQEPEYKSMSYAEQYMLLQQQKQHQQKQQQEHSVSLTPEHVETCTNKSSCCTVDYVNNNLCVNPNDTNNKLLYNGAYEMCDYYNKNNYNTVNCGSNNAFVNNTNSRGEGSGVQRANHHSTGGLAMVDSSDGESVTNEMEMWISADQMLHGRINAQLASRLCYALAVKPEALQDHLTRLPSVEEGYWRYRGLVDRTHPPPLPVTLAASSSSFLPSPLPSSSLEETSNTSTSPYLPHYKTSVYDTFVHSIDPLDVYVMGAEVLPGFDEGDILRFDPERQVWMADHSIPLEGVILASMRPFCKMAREATSDDPHWVTKLIVDTEAQHSCQSCAMKDGHYKVNNSTPINCQDEMNKTSNANLSNKGKVAMQQEICTSDTYPTPPPTPNQLRAMQHNPMLKLVHEHVGAFYVYRFELNGKVYYHGTVPNFANPNKKRSNANNAKGNKAIQSKQTNVHNTNSNNKNNNVKSTQDSEFYRINNNTPLLSSTTEASTTTSTFPPISTSHMAVQQSNELYSNSHSVGNVLYSCNTPSYANSPSFANTQKQCSIYTSCNTLESPSSTPMHVPCHTNTSSTANIVHTSSNDNNNNNDNNHNYPKSIASALFSYNTPSFHNVHHNRSSYIIHETNNGLSASPSSFTSPYSNINTNNVVIDGNVNTNNVVFANNHSTNIHADNTLQQTTTTFSSSSSISSAALPHSSPIPQDEQQQLEQHLMSHHVPNQFSEPSHEPVSYLTNRVTSSAVETARRWMRSLYSYAYGAPTRSNNNNNISHYNIISRNNSCNNKANSNNDQSTLSVHDYNVAELKIEPHNNSNNDNNATNYNVSDDVHKYTINTTSDNMSDLKPESININVTRANYTHRQQLDCFDVYKQQAQHQERLQNEEEMCNVHSEHSVSASPLQNNNKSNTLQTSSNMLWSQLPHPSLSSSYYTQKVRTNTQTENGTEDAAMNKKGNETLQSTSETRYELELQELSLHKDNQQTFHSNNICNANYDNNTDSTSYIYCRNTETSSNVLQYASSHEVHVNTKGNACQSIPAAQVKREMATPSHAATSAHSRNSSFTTCQSATSHERFTKHTDQRYRKEQHRSNNYKYSHSEERRKRQQSERHCLTLPATYPAHVTSKPPSTSAIVNCTENGGVRQGSLSKVAQSNTASPISIQSPLHPLKQFSDDGEKFVWNWHGRSSSHDMETDTTVTTEHTVNESKECNKQQDEQKLEKNNSCPQSWH